MKEFVTIKDIWMFLLAAPVYSMEYKISIFFILCISSWNIRKKIENKKKIKNIKKFVIIKNPFNSFYWLHKVTPFPSGGGAVRI